MIVELTRIHKQNDMKKSRYNGTKHNESFTIQILKSGFPAMES